MIKKTISIVLALVFALSLLTIIASAAGGDAPSTWAVLEVDRAKGLGLVPPTLQSKYSDATTRAEFCLLAVTLYEKVTGTTITGRLKFTDTTDVNVEKAAFIGVVNGVGNDRFDPNAALTREQAATMLARLAASVSKPLDKKAATFVDKGSVSTWAIEAVGQCEAAEIMGGTGNNKFSPGGAYQRQQSIATITRMYDYLDGKGTPNHAMEVTTTTPTPTPEPTMPTTTPPPSTGNDSNLVGTWRGSLNGVERYYEFKADGTFMGRVYSDSGGTFANQVGSARNLLIKGIWRLSERKIYFTDTYYFSWSVGSTPPDKIDWYKGADDSWTIETGQGGNEVDVIGYDRNARWIKVLDFVYVTTDGSLPDAYLVMANSALPSWAFPAGMAPIEADPNDKYVPISLDSPISINTTYKQQSYYFVFTAPTAGTYSFRSSNSGSSDPSCSLRDEPGGRIIILADDDFSDGYSTDFVATYHSVSANQKIYAEVMSREIGSYTLTVTRDN